MKRGFVKIPNRVFETKFWGQDHRYSEFEAMVDIYNAVDSNYIFETTLRTLADRWRWDKMRVLRFLSQIAKEGFIFFSSLSAKTFIKVCDFGDGKKIENDLPKRGETVSETASETVKAPLIKGLQGVSETPNETPNETISRVYMNDNSYISMSKEDIYKNPPKPPKGYETFDFSYVDISLMDIFFEWLSYKRERKDKYTTDRGIKTAYKKLFEFSKGDPHLARLIVEQSMANNWKGLFNLKDYGNNRTNYSREQQRRNDIQLRMQEYADVAAGFRRQAELDLALRNKK